MAEMEKTYNDIQKNCQMAGTSLERVRQVHPHQPKFGNGCAAPILRTVDLYQGRPLGPKIPISKSNPSLKYVCLMI